MTRSTTAIFIASLLATLSLTACGPASNGGTGDGDAGVGDSCTAVGAQTRCFGQSFQTCEGGKYVTTDTCVAPDVCAPDLGCAACNPQQVNTCVGDDLYTCNADGTVGTMVKTCGFEMCANGHCAGDMDCTADGTQLIYVVDVDYNLWSFNPAMDMNTFTKIGSGPLNCPAGTPWPAVTAAGETQAAPFSMAVDRTGKAWVLYTSGEIFWVSTTDASCTASPFVPGSGGFKLFGMGFVSDAVGSNSEHLYLSGGPDGIYSGDNTNENLGSVNPSTLAVSTIGPVTNLEYSPELTGTGNAELWAYFPGFTGSGAVARLDKTNATRQQSYTLPALSGTVTAWAFAHYGGRYYIFVTTADALGISETSQVLRLNPMGNGGAGQVDTILASTGHKVVGAGVSTCAPVVVN